MDVGHSSVMLTTGTSSTINVSFLQCLKFKEQAKADRTVSFSCKTSHFKRHSLLSASSLRIQLMTHSYLNPTPS